MRSINVSLGQREESLKKGTIPLKTGRLLYNRHERSKIYY